MRRVATIEVSRRYAMWIEGHINDPGLERPG
jgi:hypothetical protein